MLDEDLTPKPISGLFRSIVSKLKSEELTLLEKMNSQTSQLVIAQRNEFARIIDQELEPSRKTYLINYKTNTITAYFGDHKPDKSCKTRGSGGRLVYATWYSGDGYPFYHCFWRHFKFVRCTQSEFGIYLKNRFGPCHMSAEQFASDSACDDIDDALN